MSGRAKRVLVYTAGLLAAPLPVMPYTKGTTGFALGVLACGVVLSRASLYVFRGELALRHRGPLGNKLLAASSITTLFGVSLVLGSVVYLGRG